MRLLRLNSRMKSFLVRIALMAFSICGVSACGIEVGNPTEPTPVQPKNSGNGPGSTSPNEPIRVDVSYLVENQYDEAITASLENSAVGEIGAALGLLPSLSSRICAEQMDGSLALNLQETHSDNRSSGAASSGKAINESYSRVFTSKLQSPGATLACTPNKSTPSIDWTLIKDLKVDGTLQRTNTRNIIAKASSQLMHQSSIKSFGTHQSSVKTLQYSPTMGLSLQRILGFETELEVSAKSAGAEPKIFGTRLQTVANDPLVIEDSYTANLKLKTIKIVSGSVSSTKIEDGLLVILRYKNVVIDAQRSCRPVSGEVKGEIFAANDPANTLNSFKIDFLATENFIVYSDGSKSQLEFESCRIDSSKDSDKEKNEMEDDEGS